ncbi:hypothetical protein MTR67_030753 [Solanum verrucosum]|uniref:Putative plant transposon protein domain-containing protein n=1 Tax=Solanum verrucosum TaxID=315347 RepID=A0AAF0ZF18_SOLVR|nr:hypothetical protein MTR67_030753 [Solanum verrucosum]
MMTQMDLLTKHVTGIDSMAMNAVEINSGVNPDEAYFEAMYNEEEQFLANQVGCSRPNYPRPKVPGKGPLPQKRVKRVVNETEVPPPRPTEPKLPPTWGKARVQIENKYMHNATRYWFDLINSTLMPSQNEPILCHPNVTLLGSIYECDRLNPGLIIEKEMAIRAKQIPNSLPFPVLIIELCRRARVPFVAKADMEVTLTFSNDIERIKAGYTRDEAKWRRTTSVDTSLVVDLETLETNVTPSAQTGRPSGTPSSFTPTTSVVAAAVFQPSLTQSILYKMGHLAHSADVHASIVEAAVPGLIEQAIVASLSPI